MVVPPLDNREAYGTFHDVSGDRVNIQAAFDGYSNYTYSDTSEQKLLHTVHQKINHETEESKSLKISKSSIPEDHTSLWIVCLLIFICGMVQGIFFPTMLALCQSLNGDQILLGYVNGSFSLCRMVMLPVFGRWSSSRGYRWTFLISSCIVLLGSVMMTQVLVVGKKWFLILSNDVLGIGSSTLGVSRAYTSLVTPKNKRTGYLALITAVQYCGMTVTPFLGGVLLHQLDWLNIGYLNQFSSPAIIMTATSIASLYIIFFYFHDIPSFTKSSHHSENDKNTDQLYNSIVETENGFKRSNRSSVLIALGLLNLFLKGTMSCFETFGIKFAEARFHLSNQQTANVVSICGFLGSVILLIIKVWIAERLDDIQIMSLGYFFYVAGICTHIALNDATDSNPTWRYLISMFCIYSVGYPVSLVGLLGLFSKVAGKSSLGTHFGFLSMAGACSRVIFPIIFSYIVVYKGIEVVFTILAIFLIASFAFIHISRQTLIDLCQST